MAASPELRTLLGGVSRSFAVCIDRLDQPEADWVALAYLLCRVSDTIEDSPWVRVEDQASAFSAWLRALSGCAQLSGDLADELRRWLAQVPTESPDERRLLSEAPQLLARLSELPIGAREPILNGVCSMTKGMQHFSQKAKGSVRLKLRSALEVNQYCFFVAGLVGEILTRLFEEAGPFSGGSQEQAAVRMVRAHHFGLFLQKINLLKDQRVDEAQGRHLVLDREDLLSSLVVHVRAARDYILDIPPQGRAFQVFCAWSLGLAVLSLATLDEGYAKGGVGKITREETMRLFEAIDVWSPSELGAQMSLWIDTLPESPGGESVTETDEALSSEEIESLYSGALCQQDLVALGVLSKTQRRGVEWTASLSSR